MSGRQESVLEAAPRYLSQGWRVIPVHYGEMRPGDAGWPLSTIPDPRSAGQGLATKEEQ